MKMLGSQKQNLKESGKRLSKVHYSKSFGTYLTSINLFFLRLLNKTVTMAEKSLKFCHKIYIYRQHWKVLFTFWQDIQIDGQGV